MQILVTGAAGKVGQALLAKLPTAFPTATIRALLHHRDLAPQPGLTTLKGSLSDRATAEAAVAGCSHVVHLATCKEVPDDVMDVTVKGLFWLLEAWRNNPLARRFVLIGGDAAVGHFLYPHDGPVTETTPHRAYPGCYALSKVLEEVMLSQFGQQYDLDWTCLRAPWIMEKDDFRASLSFGPDRFGGLDWAALAGPDRSAEAIRTGAIPLLQDHDGQPLKRNFVHVSDLVSAICAALTAPAARQRLYNIAMDEPVDYAEVARILAQTRGLPSIPVRSGYHSTWLSNARARSELGWRPAYDTHRLVTESWAFARAPDDPRRVWYPG
ncbi:NAD(P)-dependent oxidoreductase [Pseudotabrizicola sp. 4114]|uniref:NAD-dependent epimerase/dehydratase family protein n=1 Tax=Pseudotabrizicola sp. 4114 TaxID=2817731 RepID=UPI0028562B13|nr:nucleoside-diphosphate-sugar epimerase [Pseudorhodobacter sp. 4114]